MFGGTSENHDRSQQCFVAFKFRLFGLCSKSPGGATKHHVQQQAYESAQSQ